MIDLHTHSLLSDGELLPSELARRAKVIGYTVIGISDHVDTTNFEHVATSIVKLVKKANFYNDIAIIPGAEITHVPPGLIKEIAGELRKIGIGYVVVHGETIAEPVKTGTNREAIMADVDILAHPGIITEEDMALAAKKGTLIEISARKGHCLTNGHVATLAKRMGARLVIDTDAHSPSDLITDEYAKRVVIGAGLSEDDFLIMQKNAEDLSKRVINRIL
ncbi:MAG TPA: histidinol phosphate phosphatase domain-containing protein [Syntrophorhabdaceae bacterium]|nr:histidinol phosphate phosphatase domain-containing protein [Syntrophorhabdaceae bacterium]